jgi:pilus assembly protein CpaB
MDRQRMLLIFGAAWVSAILLTWFLYSKTKEPQKEKTIQLVAVTRDLPAGTRLQKADLKLVAVPERDLPRSAVLDLKIAENRTLLYPLTANEPLITSKLASLSGAEGVPATIEPGMRAISVPITDISGVAGLLQPRAHVDLLFTRAGSMAEALTTTVLEDVVVLSIGRNTEVAPPPPSGQAAPAPAASPVTQQRAITLLVTPEDARKVELAKNQGRLSLLLRNPLDRSRLEKNEPVTGEVLDPFLLTRARRRPPPGVDVRDPQAWAALTGGAPPKKEEKKEPPKPRFVIDVYRGDKHLQESFH